jgi:acyl-ACP thioesterase
MFYTQQLITPNYLCDQHDNLAMWAAARLFQEVAGYHIATSGIGFSQLIQQGKAWVLCRSYYQVRRLPHEGEHLMLRTWSRGTDGLFAFREFQLLDEQGEAAVASTTYWAVIDLATRKVLRMHDRLVNFEHHPDLATDRDTIDRLRLPKGVERPTPAAQFAVRPSMLDHTSHVNNAEYVKWVFDHLPQGSAPSLPFRFSIEYVVETPPNDTVSVFAYPQPGSTIFQITNSNAVAVMAKIDY